MDLRFSTVDALDKYAGIWGPTTRVRRSIDVAHWSAMDNVFGESTVVGYAVRSKSDYNYKTDFEILRENQEFELQNNARS